MNKMIYVIVNSANKFVLILKRSQKIKLNTDTVKINIGSGLSQTANRSWINIDCNFHILFSKWPIFILKVLYRLSDIKKCYSQKEYLDILINHTFVYHNMEYGIPFSDESVDYIYSSHLLEHLYRDDGAKLLREAYRVLKKDGLIRICIPDLEYAVSLYQKGNKAKALDFFFATSKSEYFSSHKYLYDFELLKSILDDVGFIDVKRCYYKQGKVPDIDKLDNRPDETLFVEAAK